MHDPDLPDPPAAGPRAGRPVVATRALPPEDPRRTFLLTAESAARRLKLRLSKAQIAAAAAVLREACRDGDSRRAETVLIEVFAQGGVGAALLVFWAATATHLSGRTLPAPFPVFDHHPTGPADAAIPADGQGEAGR